MNKTKRLINWRLILVVAIIFVIGGYGWISYVSDSYPASNYASKAMWDDNRVTVDTLSDNTIVFVPAEIKAGMIFYPGGKVDYKAYAPLLKEFAKNGVLCILPKMHDNLAFFGINSADNYLDEYKKQYPDAKKWYMAGHSLGGAMACIYTSKHVDELDGLILMASFSTKDLSQSGLQVVSLYGTEDKVLNMEKYQENLANLPADYTEIQIDGGCHSYFGSYGIQSEDGEPTISNEEQIQTTVDTVLSVIYP